MDPAQFKAKIDKIRHTFRSAKDLHSYLSEVRKFPTVMPNHACSGIPDASAQRLQT